MLKRLLMPLMLILLLPQFMRAQDVAVYPIDVNAIITPPHGTCLKDYVGSRRFMVNVLLRDMTKRPDDFVVEMSVKNAGGRVVFRSYFGNFSLHPGKPAYLDSEIQNGFISQLFNENNISIGRGYATKCFEEGAYTISFQAFSAYHYPQRRIALSRASATTLFMQSTVQGPYLIYPYNKDSIACSETVINFQWQSANPTGEPLSYQLQVAEVPEGVSANRAFEQNSVLVEDVQNLYHSIYQSVKTEGKYRADVTYAWRVLVNKPSGESHISPVYTFVYCGTPQVPEPEIPYDPVLSSKRMDYSLDSLHIDSVDTVSITPLAYWKNKPEIAGKGYCGIGIEVRKQGQDKWTPYIINTVDTTKFLLSNLSYGTLYEIRGQYIKCGEQDTLYGPYGDTLQFIIPDPNRAADCGDDIPPLTDCGDSKGKIMRVGDTINANGTSVIIDSLSYDEKDSTIITGKGHIEFPIIKNIRLWTKFEKIQINCAGELAKGNIVSIYDPRTAAMIDLEELTGENSTGGGDNPVANSTTEAYSKEKFDAAPAGSFFTKGDTVVMKDDSGNEEIIGREISLSSDEYASRNALADDAHFLEFRNDIDPDNVAFDNDKDNIYSRIDQGKEGYQKFSNAGGRNYIIPWLANNPGKLKPLSVKDINLKGGSLFDSVKFVMPTNGKYIELSCETTGEGEYKIRIPGGAGTRNSFEVYALGKMKGNSSYQDAGKLLIANYAPRTQKVIIVPVLKEYAVSPDMEQQLNQIYGRLGVSYEVVLDKVFTEIDTVLIDSLKNGLKIGADDESRWQVETQEMKWLRYSYQLAKGDALDKNAAYIFLVEKAEEPYVGVEGDMPRNQSVGYIFMNGKESLADGRLVAHELGHGVYKLQHTFAYKQLAETKGKTDNLMDYNGGTFLAHYQWRVMQDSVMFVWKVLQEDEDGLYQPWVFEEGHIIEDFYAIPDEYLTFASSDGQKLVLPNEKTKLVRFVDGYVVSFVIDGELWHATTRGGHFVGYYKDAKAYKQTGEESYKVSTKGCLPYKMGGVNVNKDSVYIPLFTGEDRCAKPLLYKVQYVYQSDKNQTTRESEFNQLYDKVKAMNSQSEDAEIIGHYVSLGDNVLDFNINCLSDSQREFYLFMTYYYDYYTGCNCSNLDERKKRLYSTIERYEIKIHGLDDTDNCSAEIDLSSNKGASIADFLEKIDQMNIDGGSLCVTLDNYSVFQDFYLKVFTPVKEKEPKCTQEQWESDLTMLENFKKAIKNKTNLKFTIKGNEKNIVPGIYDFCDYIVFEVCKDYLHTVKYEIIEDYLRFIVDHCSGKNEGGFSLETFWHQFDERAEKASLWLMSAIDKSDYDKFANFLAENKNGVLFGYMEKFDDAHVTAIFHCDGNNFTRFMRVLVTMFRANPNAFIDTDPTHYDYKQKILINEGFVFNYGYAESSGLCHLKIEGNDGEVIYNGDNLSPFQQVYFLIDKENAPQKELVGDFSEFNLDNEKYKELEIEPEADVFLLSCPLIFLQYYKDKDNVETGENFACAAGIVVGAAALAVLVGPELVAYTAANGASKALSWVAARYGQKVLTDFITGAIVDGTVYMLGQEFSRHVLGSNDEIVPMDLLYHMIVGGLSNIVSNRLAKSALTCAQAMDFTAMYGCVVNGPSNCEYKKLFLECGSSVVFDQLLLNDKVKEFFTGKYRSFMFGKLIKKWKDVPRKYLLNVFAKQNNLRPSFPGEIIQLSNTYGGKGFEVLCDANFDFKYLDSKTLRKVFEAMQKDGSEASVNSLKEALSKNNESVAKLLTMLDKVSSAKTFTKKINEIWEKAEKLTIQGNNGQNVKFSDILNNPNKYDPDMKVFSKYIEEDNSIFYRYVVMGKVVEAQVKAGSSFFNTTIVKIVDWRYAKTIDEKVSEEKTSNDDDNDGFEIVDIYEEE